MTYQELLELKNKRAMKLQEGQGFLAKKDLEAHKALMGVLDDIAKGENDSDGDDTPDTPSSKHIYVTGSSVNVRSGPATTYKVLTRVNKGDTMPYIATAEALGWHAVEIGGKIGWISGKYSSVEEG